MSMEIRFWMWIVGSLESSARVLALLFLSWVLSCFHGAVMDSSLYIYLWVWGESWSPAPHPGSNATRRRRISILPQFLASDTHEVTRGLPGSADPCCASRLLSCGDGCFIEPEQHRGQKFLPERSRILGLVAFQETWLHRTRFLASFLW